MIYRVAALKAVSYCLSALSVNFVSHLKYQFWNFNMALVGRVAVTEFVTTDVKISRF